MAANDETSGCYYYERSEQMADFCCSPSSKRSRIDLNSDYYCNNQTVSELNSRSITFEVSSSTSCDVDLNGGDSGFQELKSSNCSPSTSHSDSPVDGRLSSVHDPTINETTEASECDESGQLDIDEKHGNCDNFSEDGSYISDISCGSYLSNMSGEQWKPISCGALNWVQQQISVGTNPRDILQEIVPNACIAPEVESLTLWKLIMNFLSEPPPRKKLAHVNTVEDVVSLIHKSQKIIVLTGAGVSVSCGIPDFRSRDGIYARLSKDFPDLPDPQSMFDIHYFRRDQRPFFKFAKEIFPGLFSPSISHKFIKVIEKHGKLLRNYSQNIDTLEKAAGIERVITCHGSFATATCTRCKHKVDASVIKEDVFAQRIPYCTRCSRDEGGDQMAVLKPDIVFFGEGLSDEFHDAMSIDKDNCDLLIVMGSSLKVRPVALIPSSIPADIPQVLINREKLHHLNFDVELLGDCDVIVQELCNRLGEGWNDYCESKELLTQINEIPQRRTVDEEQVNNSEINNNDGLEANEVSESLDEAKTQSQVSSSVDTFAENSCLQPDSTNDECEDFESTYRRGSNVAERLSEGTFLFCAPNQYVFKGAEVFEDELKADERLDENDECSQSSSSSKSDSSESSSEGRDEQI
ncbi:NAD-dependent protein deacetylase sirtuin-1-like protein, partial [Dinothrombium tinctorium]